ncbi:hypothetical protein B4158_0909 [Bacillus cereus]|nr:hypothetical protein B4158_0909 [Bacillus cereus]
MKIVKDLSKEYTRKVSHTALSNIKFNNYRRRIYWNYGSFG